jgi:Protein kinase domain
VAGQTIRPGTVLAGRFSLDDLLDESGGAQFWRATDRTLARSVAVHVLPATDPRAGSLLTAARTSALVSDGHLLRVLDAAAEDGVVYVVNEWGGGVSLDKLLVEGPLSPRRAAWVVKEVAEAISTAHRSGVAHGRLLPENVMISDAGSVKLIGFVIDAVLRDNAGRDQHRVTGGAPISAHESDVVNLAALLYAALVGRWPGTEGSTIPAAPSDHGRPMRPRQVRAGVPRPLDAICERVLNADVHPHMVPIETAHEIYAALSDYIGDPGAAAATIGVPVGYEATAAIDRDELPEGDGTGTDGDTSDLPPTGALPLPGGRGARDAGPAADPDATQAGVPMFFDEDTGVGWASAPGGRGPRADGAGPGPDHAAALDAARREPPPRRAPAPPPPEPPARPLFAEGRSAAAGVGGSAGSVRHDTGSFTSGQRSTGAGNGFVPATWGPDAGQAPPADEGWDGETVGDEVPGRRWLRLAVVLAVVLVLVVVTVTAYNLARDPGSEPTPATGRTGSPSASTTPSVRVPIRGVSDFDPQGDPSEENPELAPLAVDGKPGTAWRTLTYRGNPELGGLKSGVGLLVDLGEPARVGDVRLRLLGSPTSVQILAAPDADQAPTDTDGLDTVATEDDAGTSADLALRKPVTTRWLVVWLTSLPPAPGGFRGEVAEISLRS